MKKFQCNVGSCSVLWTERPDGGLTRETPTGPRCFGQDDVNPEAAELLALHGHIKEVVE